MDLKILRWINNNLHANEFINNFFKYVTMLGTGAIVWIILCLVLLCIKKTRKAAIVMSISLATEALSVVLIKLIIQRIRPFVVESSFFTFINDLKIPIPTDSSFPSGHTASSVVCCAVLLYFFGKKSIVCVILSFLISLSRLFLCVHYPSDIIGGIIIALLSFKIVLTLTKKYCKKHGIELKQEDKIKIIPDNGINTIPVNVQEIVNEVNLVVKNETSEKKYEEH